MARSSPEFSVLVVVARRKSWAETLANTASSRPATHNRMRGRHRRSGDTGRGPSTRSAGMDTMVHKKDIFVTCIRDNRTRCPVLQQRDGGAMASILGILGAARMRRSTTAMGLLALGFAATVTLSEQALIPDKSQLVDVPTQMRAPVDGVF